MRPLANNAEYIDRRQVLAYLSTVYRYCPALLYYLLILQSHVDEICP